MKYIVCAALITVFAAVGFAQSKTITNSDLEQYRQKRLAAEKDLRENYEALGFPSPEELARQNEESARERSESAERYRKDLLERRQADGFASPNITNNYYQQEPGRSGYYRYYGGYGTVYYYGNIRRNRHQTVRTPGPGYISNPIIRGAWLRQSESMRNTYRGNFYKPRTRTRN